MEKGGDGWRGWEVVGGEDGWRGWEKGIGGDGREWVLFSFGLRVTIYEKMDSRLCKV